MRTLFSESGINFGSVHGMTKIKFKILFSQDQKTPASVYPLDTFHGNSSQVMKIFAFLLVVTVCVIEAEPYNPTSGKRPALIQYPPQEVFIQGAKDTYLNCTFTNTIDTGIHWFKDNKRIVSDKKKFTINRKDTETGTQSHLVIDQGLSTANGSYYCEAENKYGSIASHKVHLKAAYFSLLDRLVNLGNEKISAGKYWRTYCADVDSKPRPIFYWFKRPMNYTAAKGNKMEIREKVANSLRTLVTEDGTLMIASLRKTDKGRYECEAFNKKTRRYQTVATVNLDIGDKIYSAQLRKLYNPTPVPVLVGKDTRMYAFFAYGKNITVTWKKGSKTLTDYQDKTELTITKAQKSDAGVYTITATPVDRSTSPLTTTIVLEVKELPVIVEGPVNMNITGQDPKIHCNATGTPDPQIFWTVHTKGNHTLVQTSENEHLVLAKQRAGIILVLTCNASNDVGYQIARAEVSFTNTRTTTERNVDGNLRTTSVSDGAIKSDLGGYRSRSVNNYESQLMLLHSIGLLIVQLCRVYCT